jgi:hypothetical protein
VRSAAPALLLFLSLGASVPAMSAEEAAARRAHPLQQSARRTPAQVIVEDALRTAVADGFKRPRQPSIPNISTTSGTALETYGPKQAEFLREKVRAPEHPRDRRERASGLRFVLQFRDRMLPGVPSCTWRLLPTG